MLHSSHFSFFVFGHFWQGSNKNTKISRNFVYILQGKMGNTEKKRKENCAATVTKNQNTKIWDERNINFNYF